MSKKLIAVASAAALAMSLLVSAPATATAQSFALTGAIGGTTSGLVAATPATVGVPSDNTLVSGTNAVTITATGAAGDVLTATATGTVRLVNAAATGTADLNVTTLGVTSLTKSILTGVTTTTVLAYNTSVTAGTVVVTLTRPGGVTASTTFHLRGIAGPAYNIAVVSGVPATLANAATSVVSFKLTDVFGNEVENSSTTGTLLRLTNMGAVTWDAASKTHRSTMTSPGAGPFIASVAINHTDASNSTALTTAQGGNVPGLPAGTKNLIAVVNNAGVSDQVATLTAQVASLTTQLANSRAKDRSVTKKRFNALARKWNAANPTDRVALKR